MRKRTRRPTARVDTDLELHAKLLPSSSIVCVNKFGGILTPVIGGVNEKQMISKNTWSLSWDLSWVGHFS